LPKRAVFLVTVSRMLEKLVFHQEKRARTAFYASDYGKPALDLYFNFTGEPVTNPPSWNNTLKWGAGRGVEDQMLIVLKQSGIVEENYDQKLHGRIEHETEGIKIHGYIDALSKNGNPLEIKSVNNANKFDVLKYKRNEPKENYVGQLATYMEVKQSNRGALFVSTIDGLNYFWFDCVRLSPGIYRCGNVTIDIRAEYKRWADLYHNNILPRKMPDIWQYRYKYDVNTIDWRSIPKAKITAARTNAAVIGDWQVQWSDWKNKIVELQGTCLGYSNEELSTILEKTKGYTTWK
jgi:hypothetical protein